MAPRTGLLVSAHGTVQSLEELPAFLTVIRRGRPASPALITEVTHRYRAIGGRSPLTELTEGQARGAAAKLGALGYVGMRLWGPSIRDAVSRAVSDGVERLVSLPAAPFSTGIYHEPVAQALAELDPEKRVSLIKVGPWGSHPSLVRVFAQRARAAGALEEGTRVLFTAHSLPTMVVERGDPYPTLVSHACEEVAKELGLSRDRWSLAYQSQGASEGPWLGPDLVASFDALASEKAARVVIVAIGFLSDHVEVLYDLDIEAKAWASDRGIELVRAECPNDQDDLAEAMAQVAREAMQR
jgi:ferrochelatase